MKAFEFLNQRLRGYPENRENVSVLGLLEDGGWWHIHKDEDIPEDKSVAVKFRNPHRLYERGEWVG